MTKPMATLLGLLLFNAVLLYAAWRLIVTIARVLS